jgi:SAM-dependent methyltransferase
MHPSAFEHMAQCIKEYVPTTGRLRVVDVGSRNLRSRKPTHRELFESYDAEYIGVDIVMGPNVDLKMTRPYRLPFRANSTDVVVSSQVFEHIPFMWVSMIEIARVLKPNGYAFIIAPSRGHRHGSPDCWRFYPDGMRALAVWSGLELCEASTDFPPHVGSTVRFNYSAIDPAEYWGDAVGVFRKPTGYPRVRTAIVRSVVTTWGNHVGGINGGSPSSWRARLRRR